MRLWVVLCFFFSSRRRHTRWPRDWSSDVCSSDLDEPEYGVVVSVAARHGGIDGEYTLGSAIDRDAAVCPSQERGGQPKYLASIRYFRLGDRVVASATHQGYTFLRFNGQIGEPMATEGELETNEWWIKSMRSVDMQPGSYDFPPHVVHVYSKYGTAHKVHVDGQDRKRTRLNSS